MSSSAKGCWCVSKYETQKDMEVFVAARFAARRYTSRPLSVSSKLSTLPTQPFPLTSTARSLPCISSGDTGRAFECPPTSMMCTSTAQSAPQADHEPSPFRSWYAGGRFTDQPPHNSTVPPFSSKVAIYPCRSKCVGGRPEATAKCLLLAVCGSSQGSEPQQECAQELLVSRAFWCVVALLDRIDIWNGDGLALKLAAISQIQGVKGLKRLNYLLD